ncbi:Uncharacterised protein [Chromobacterium violaceum]|uniref:Uncharacterized protein n=2 Tax=Chromobacterium violaceum TaxID=536 RepID=A0AAX2MC58_CHRVL|nr:Uncharacterised protein [Chromobacterium violaceum]SUX33431.1 Uncharacterised protein [Chromobacterium violaceum]
MHSSERLTFLMLFCMSARIPSSLNWLINKRARLLSDLQQLEKSLPRQLQSLEADVQKAEQALEMARHRFLTIPEQLTRGIESTRASLAAIDTTIRLHEVRIDPEIIPPIRSHSKNRFTRYGGLTRMVINILHEAQAIPMTTDQISILVGRIMGVDVDGDGFSECKLSVRYRLKDLCKAKRVHRVKPGLWILPGYLRDPSS